jgi:hypothetical protein
VRLLPDLARQVAAVAKAVTETVDEAQAFAESLK